MDEKTIARFWSKVDRRGPDECWLWQASTQTSGYGQMNLGRGRVWLAHRFSFLVSRGNIPKGLFVCHTCDVRNCVNPGHLFLGTPADNAADMARKRRGKGCPRPGTSNPACKLSTDSVLSIFFSTKTQRESAREHGVSQRLVQMIKSGKKWSTVTGASAVR